MTPAELLQLGPIAVVSILLVRELVAAWKWREERREKSEAERHADDVRELVTVVREDLATARAQLAGIVTRIEDRSEDTATTWRTLYETLSVRVRANGDDRIERLAGIATRSAEALEAAAVVIEAALERLED